MPFESIRGYLYLIELCSFEMEEIKRVQKLRLVRFLQSLGVVFCLSFALTEHGKQCDVDCAQKTNRKIERFGRGATGSTLIQAC